MSGVVRLIRYALRGPSDEAWTPPRWLLPHQIDAARRVAGSLEVFRCAVLADAVGLGKSYVALAVADRYRRVSAVVPAAILPQWRRTAEQLHVPLRLVSHEALSRKRPLPPGDLIIVDEAHRFRNPATRRYDRLARSIGPADVLFVTATPTVNGPRDLVSLLRIAFPDHALAFLGLPSLEAAMDPNGVQALARATTALVIARTHRSLNGAPLRLPEPSDRAVVREGPASGEVIDDLVRQIEDLEFPSVGDRSARELLRMHLLYRLASSLEAFRETLRAHEAYLRRAIEAGVRGEALSRRRMRMLFRRTDAWQLELGLSLGWVPLAEPDREHLQAELARVARLLRWLPSPGHENPKAARLACVLRERGHRKTLVFTTAVATGLDLARRLQWRRVAVVGGGRAWIASGRVTTETALGLFAPRARKAPDPSRRTVVSTLIATDLASEGLDLQDSDAVVHYDLPWTPLRLTQRLGRISRLGSRHERAHVWWFAPPNAIERQLSLAARIARKASSQHALGISLTSAVGKARVFGTLAELREAASRGERPIAGDRGCFAVVRGPVAAIAVIEWRAGRLTVRDVVGVRAPGADPVELRYADLFPVLQALADAAPSGRPAPAELIAALSKVVRTRLESLHRRGGSASIRMLRRRLLSLGRHAARRRALKELGLLDRVLDVTTRGLTVGNERSLACAVTSGGKPDALEIWLSQLGAPLPDWSDFRILATLFGDGTLEGRHR